MKLNFSEHNDGSLNAIVTDDYSIAFNPKKGPRFYIESNGKVAYLNLTPEGGAFSTKQHDIHYSLAYLEQDRHVDIIATIENKSEAAFTPDAMGLSLGIDTYMMAYPQWNEVFFPTMLRCEKSSFWGYFMSPEQRIVAITCNTAVAAWELDYNKFGDEDGEGDYGHRIHTAKLMLLTTKPLPARHPQHLNVLQPNERLSWTFRIFTVEDLEQLPQTIHDIAGLPNLSFDRYVYSLNEEACVNVTCSDAYSLRVTYPSGKIVESQTFLLDEYGSYTVTCLSENGIELEANVFCRKPYLWYLERARENAIQSPQKASTHAESWYGHFSNFLAKKHKPMPELDRLAQMNFDEIMPLMYDF